MSSSGLSRRERQIMEIVYRCARASVAEIRAAMPERTSYSAVRVIVNVLERKGHLRHTKVGRKYIYRPCEPRTRAIRRAVQQLLATYFADSLPRAVAAMVQLRGGDLSEADVRELVRTIETSKGTKRS